MPRRRRSDAIACATAAGRRLSPRRFRPGAESPPPRGSRSRPPTRRPRGDRKTGWARRAAYWPPPDRTAPARYRIPRASADMSRNPARRGKKTAMRGAVAPQDRADAAFDAGVGKPADELGPPVDAIAVSSAGRSLMVEPIRGIRQIDLVLVVDNFSIYRDHFALDQGAIEDIWPILTPTPYALPTQFKTNLARQIMPFQCG